MKDINIDANTKTIQFIHNDIDYVKGDDELAQSIWSLLNINLNNLIPDNGNVMLGTHFNEEYIANVINNLLTNFDTRISTNKINKIGFSDKTRTLEIDLEIVTNDGKSVRIGGNLDVG